MNASMLAELAHLNSAQSKQQVADLAVAMVSGVPGVVRCAIWTGPGEAVAQSDPDTASCLASDALAQVLSDRIVPLPNGRALPLVWQGEVVGGLAVELDGEGTEATLADVGVVMPMIATCLRNAENYEQLEMLVEQELATSVERELAIQLILDSMRDGLLVCDLAGQLTEVRSRVVETWLGAPEAGEAIWNYLARDEEMALTLQLGFEQLFEDLMPFGMSAEQMPALLQRGGRSYRLGFERVEQDGQFHQVVVSLRDVTEQLAMEKAEAEQRELIEILSCLLRNQDAFSAFLTDTDRLLSVLRSEELKANYYRTLHTLKGNTAIFGFRSFAALCHQYEEAANDQLGRGELARELECAWNKEMQRIGDFIDRADGSTVVVHADELNYLLAELNDEGLRRLVQSWCRPSFARVLEPNLRRAAQIALERGKRVELSMEGGHLRVPDEQLRPFLASLVHPMNNAVDHGIEPPAERSAAGKSEAGSVQVLVEATEHTLTVTVQDDGRGIDWGRLAAAAAAKGLPHETRDDLVEALFSDGLSTASAVTNVSGRGVGMAAVREECRRLQGAISVASTPGHGTSFRFEIDLRHLPASKPATAGTLAAKSA